MKKLLLFFTLILSAGMSVINATEPNNTNNKRVNEESEQNKDGNKKKKKTNKKEPAENNQGNPPGTPFQGENFGKPFFTNLENIVNSGKGDNSLGGTNYFLNIEQKNSSIILLGSDTLKEGEDNPENDDLGSSSENNLQTKEKQNLLISAWHTILNSEFFNKLMYGKKELSQFLLKIVTNADDNNLPSTEELVRIAYDQMKDKTGDNDLYENRQDLDSQDSIEDYKGKNDDCTTHGSENNYNEKDENSDGSNNESSIGDQGENDVPFDDYKGQNVDPIVNEFRNDEHSVDSQEEEEHNEDSQENEEEDEEVKEAFAPQKKDYYNDGREKGAPAFTPKASRWYRQCIRYAPHTAIFFATATIATATYCYREPIKNRLITFKKNILDWLYQ